MRVPDLSSNFRLSVFQYNDSVIQIMRDRLSGFQGDYYFFQVDLDTYVLLTDFEDLSVSGYTVSASSVNVYEVDLSLGNDYSLGKFSGSGSDVGAFSGSLTNNIYLYSFSYTLHNISIQNDLDVMSYSSFDNSAHLREGSDYYAFAEIFLLCIVCVFVLCDLIFRRVYR